ncbi:MAG: bifunctional phosphopantothenoylcysteine decarboxylase/phosphopantothenate--cysteine ligase CoaBC [Acidobacteriota bacterium]|nr:bifunctional phosphopantothenoylcysteine decarboxylase/phosphopantothenate--cysteine ligase CoaBC [Acidobacteriota bacterium]
MPKIALGAASSVSLYKALEVLRGFQKAGCQVQPILTPNAAKLVSPLLFSTLSGRKTIVETFDDGQAWSVAHIALAKEIDLLVVAPATANVIAKFAGGIADDFLSTFFLAVEKPVLIAPAMNEAMWHDPQTRLNAERLRARGIEFVEPEAGYLACGDAGHGRLAEPETIVAAGLAILGRAKSLAGKRVLVTAGPTREAIDPVRFLSNRSSGKMGYAVAAEAIRRGAEVTLISGPTAIESPAAAEFVRVVSAADMAKAVLDRVGKADVLVMAAAVADFTVTRPAKAKIKKGAGSPSLALVPTVDILKAAAARPGRRFVVGFAAETGDLRKNARAKLKAKSLDLIVANDVSVEGRGFDADWNKALILDAGGGEIETPVLAKAELARRLWDIIESHAAKKR